MRRVERPKRRGGLVLVALASLALVGFGFALGAMTAGSPPGYRRPAEDPLSRARQLLEDGRIAEAKSLYREQLQRDQASVRALRGLAACAREDGDDDEAIRCLQQLTAVDRNDRAAWRQLALACKRAGRSQEALIAAQTAMALSNEPDPALCKLVTDCVTAEQLGLPGMPDLGALRPPDPIAGVRRPQPPDPMRYVPGHKPY